MCALVDSQRERVDWLYEMIDWFAQVEYFGGFGRPYGALSHKMSLQI